MKREKKKGQLKKIVSCLFLMLFAGGLLFDAGGAVSAAQSGVVLSMETVIPSLFPFFVLSGMILKLRIGDRLGGFADHTVCRLFGIDRELAVAYLLGLVGGYPVGARSVCMLYRDRRCTKEDAQRVLGYANNCGPAFILSVVGVFLFRSAAIGFIMYLIHIAASILLGILSRKMGKPTHTSGIREKRPPLTEAFVTSVKDGINSVINVCAFVVLFSVLIRIAGTFHLFDLLLIPAEQILGTKSVEILSAALTGLCEVTCGIRSLTAFTEISVLPVVCSFLLGFGGICVHAQTASVVTEAGLSLRPYMLSKLAHGILAALLTVPLLPLISRLFPAETTAYFPYPTVYPAADPVGVLLLYSALIAVFSAIYYIVSRIDKKSL